MTEKIGQLIRENWEKIPVSERCPAPSGPIRLAKFYHGRVNWQSKVLFLATYSGSPICFIKTTRDAAANEKLKREEEAQKKISQAGELAAPAVYFGGLIDGRYLYAEEVIAGRPLSEASARQKEEEIIKLASSFVSAGNVSAAALAEIFSENVSSSDAELSDMISRLSRSGAILRRGFSHGDLTRKNIIFSHGKLRLIDWERANERPFWLIDAVHFMVGVRDIKDTIDWEKRGAPIFMKATGVPAATAAAIYCVEALLEVFCKQFPERYAAIVKRFAQL